MGMMLMLGWSLSLVMRWGLLDGFLFSCTESEKLAGLLLVGWDVLLANNAVLEQGFVDGSSRENSSGCENRYQAITNDLHISNISS